MQHITFIVIGNNREIKRIHCASFGVLDEQKDGCDITLCLFVYQSNMLLSLPVISG